MKKGEHQQSIWNSEKQTEGYLDLCDVTLAEVNVGRVSLGRAEQVLGGMIFERECDKRGIARMCSVNK